MSSLQPVQPAGELTDIEFGLDLSSETATFTITLSPTKDFHHGVVLTPAWTDQMGLHLLQRSMLPSRVIKCALTLNNVLKISESYNQAIRRSLRIDLANVTLDSAQEVGKDFVMTMHLTKPSTTLEVKEHFDQSKFKLGGIAKLELDARGFQLGEVKDEQLIVNRCRYIKLVVSDYRTLRSEVFSSKVVSMFENAGSTNGIIKTDPDNDELLTTPLGVVAPGERPCSCWKGPGDGKLHSDACNSQWAMLFEGYARAIGVQKDVDTEGLKASRWAK